MIARLRARSTIAAVATGSGLLALVAAIALVTVARATPLASNEAVSVLSVSASANGVSMVVAIPTRMSGRTLAPADFAVLAGDQTKPSAVRALPPDSLDLVVVVDDRASVGGDVLHAELAAIAELVVGLDPGTHVALMARTNPTALQPLTTDISSALAALTAPLASSSASPDGDDGLAKAATQFRSDAGVRHALVEFLGAPATTSVATSSPGSVADAGATPANLPAGTTVYTLGRPDAATNTGTTGGSDGTGALIREVDGVLGEVTGQYAIDVDLGAGAALPDTLSLRVQLAPSHVVTVAVPLSSLNGAGSSSSSPVPGGGQGAGGSDTTVASTGASDGAATTVPAETTTLQTGGGTGTPGAQVQTTAATAAPPSGVSAQPGPTHHRDTTAAVLRAVVIGLLALMLVALTVELIARRRRGRRQESLGSGVQARRGVRTAHSGSATGTSKSGETANRDDTDDTAASDDIDAATYQSVIEQLREQLRRTTKP